jgi:hypothetical protein
MLPSEENDMMGYTSPAPSSVLPHPFNGFG